MAAYASLVSLLNTMEQIQNHPRLSTCFDKYQNESLLEKVDFFLDFVENYSDAGSRETEDLVRRIAFVAHAAEDIIECQAANRVRDGSTRKCLQMLLDLQRVIDDMFLIEEKVIKVKEETGFINRQPSHSTPPPSSAATAKTAMVGFDGYLVQLLDELTGHHSERRVLPIIGMGGIGKTTLARNVYENLLTVQHFDARAWVTVSQEYNAREILFEALSCLGGSTSKIDEGISEDRLGEQLHKTLSGRRYLIILDDVWSVEVWDKMKFFFPENYNGSRIVVTTRLSEVVDYLGSSALAVDFLDDNKSWDLFCEKTFPQEGCPRELEEIGKKIVNKCKGLPLAIVVIGGLLGKSSRTQEYWEKIANDISLILNSREGNKVLNILYLSYKHLPVCLKSCFLYLGLFPEDYDICVPELIKLWVVEGFIKPNIHQSLEEIAEGYVKELIDRSLLLVRGFKPHKRVETCCIHDLVRELSIRIGAKEKFVCVQRDIKGRSHFIVDERMASFYCPNGITHRPSLVHPLIFDAKETTLFKSRLLRVLVHSFGCLDYNLRDVSLRYLFYESTLVGLNRIRSYNLPSSISLLWSLQTLKIRGIVRVVAPAEIWEMPQLRNIDIGSLYLPHPLPPPRGKQDALVLPNLQTLKTVREFKCSKEVCKRIPNIKELQFDSSSRYTVYNVGILTKLESLEYSFGGSTFAHNLMKNLKFLSSLRKLSLQYCKLLWRDMKTLGSLPRLEVLNLSGKAAVGSKWDSVEERFLSLKHLQINGCDDLICWIADCSHFLVLDTLSLGFLEQDEIPSGIGEIPTLQKIDMCYCSESAFASAIKILEEQESLGNQGLQVELKFHDRTQAEKFREKHQLEGFNNKYLQITCTVL